MASTAPLYKNEELVSLNGFQSLIEFSKGDPSQPLIIFVPGNAHLARIGYGYSGGDPKDFLAYWLNKKGYSFLGVSYSIDNKVYDKTYPAFNIDDWGKLVIAAAKDIIIKEKLSKNIILVGWSMAGSIVQTVNLADRTTLYPWFYKWMEEKNKYNSHTIIPKEIYLTQILGNIPIALGAEGYHYENKKIFIFNIDKTIKDSGEFYFKNLPLIAQIHDDSPVTMKISSIDPYSWYFLLTQMLYQNYLTHIDTETIDAVTFKNLNKLINEIPYQLTMKVHGNHLFFVGRKGAKETADKIDDLVHSAKNIQNELNAIK